MKKSSIYLEPELDRALMRAAMAVGVSKAELIRRTLARAVAEAHRPRVSAIGIGAGPGGVADAVDLHLADSGFGE